MALSRLEYLFRKHQHKACNAPEEKELMDLLAKDEYAEAVRGLIDTMISTTDKEAQMDDVVAGKMLQQILSHDVTLAPVKHLKNSFQFWLRVAAVIILIFGGATMFWMLNKKVPAEKPVAVQEVQPPQIVPGGNRAVLTTSDGSTIVLDSLQNGTFVQSGTFKITKQDGKLVYNVSPGVAGDTQVVYNTLSTPRGGQYQVVLADGSKVWLNAASSLHFPSSFKERERIVSLTGEAYFEVAKNTGKPFKVNVGKMTVRVLGTHFNIHAYEDEGVIRTSLLEGSVQVTRGTGAGILKERQQAVITDENDRVNISKANLEEVMAWKNGLFQFDGANIKSIMLNIGRWYNVDIRFAGKPAERRFEGKIRRDAQLAEVLRILELSDVKFSVEGKTITVQ
ncbi:FecR domain-containing protein [soil metagenome]